MSGWLLMGLPGYAYLAGLEAAWIALGLFLGTYLNWRLVARRLRCYTELAENSLTLPDYLENRFADKTHLLRILSAVFILLFFLFYTSSGLVAGGKLFNTVFGIPYHQAVIAGAAAILFYTLIGGFFAVSWTDLFQGLLMALVLVLVPVAAVIKLGGWQPARDAVMRSDPALLDFFQQTDGNTLTAVGIVSLLGWGLGYFGQPHILARFTAAASLEKLTSARRIATSWVFVSLFGALLVGLTGNGLLSQTLPEADAERIFIVLVELLFHPVIAGICLAAILAAIMSTADSQLLVSASVVTQDFYRILGKRRANQIELVWVGRIAVVGVTLIALLLAWNPQSRVLELVAYAWAGLGAAFGPTVLLSLYWRNMTGKGALAGVFVGGVTVVVWKQLTGGLFDLYELVPGFILSIVAIVLASWLDRSKKSEVVNGFDRYLSSLNSLKG